MGQDIYENNRAYLQFTEIEYILLIINAKADFQKNIISKPHFNQDLTLLCLFQTTQIPAF